MRRHRQIAIVLAAVGAAACSASNPEKRNPVPSGGGTSGTGGAAQSAGGSGGSGTGGTSGSGGTGGSIDLTGGTGSGGAPEGCASAVLESDLLPPNLLFVVDRSSSMNCNLPPLQSPDDCETTPVAVNPAEPTRWAVITGALQDAFGALPTDARAGLTYFSNDNVCGAQSTPNVGVNAVDASQLSALSFSLQNVAPKGGTPIVGATILGYKHLHHQAKLFGNGFVVLITDGTETCDPDQIPRLVDIEVPKALGVNIRTFAIGAPGSENARALLSQIAWQGGTAADPGCDHASTDPSVGDCHFDMTASTDFAADLAAALDAISGTALTCELDVPEGSGTEPVDLGRVNVDYYEGGGEGTPILKDDSAPCDGGAQGWQYNEDSTKIILCGSICEKIKNDAEARVEVVLGCETIVK